MLDDRCDAEEIVQETLVTAWRRLPRASPDVTVDLARLWIFAAVDVARAVLGRLHEALVDAGVSPGLIDITVLAAGSD